MSDIDELINLLDEMTDDITRQVREAKEKALIEKLPAMLKENGVNLCITEYMCEGNSVDELRFGFGIDRLDFSEHDKVFEDKIAELKKDYKTASELLGKYQQENESLKKRIIELENFSCQAEQETESLVEKLKQRISELESRETEKPTKLNLNDRVKVKLTPLGAEIYYNRYDFLKSSIRAIGGVCTEPKMPKIDEDGYTEMTMWQFIELYGKDIGKINREVISPLDIIIAE